VAVVLFAGCATVSREEMEAAECYLFPHFKTILQPEFGMTSAERRKAIQASNKEAGTAFTAMILYELIVDGEGRVVKIRAVKPYYRDDEDQFVTRNISRILQGEQFRPDQVAKAYRTFYYPMYVDRKTEVLNWPGDL